jgi:hypothetical protein
MVQNQKQKLGRQKAEIISVFQHVCFSAFLDFIAPERTPYWFGVGIRV